eukprot:3342414-Rhodomonas_salina.2
MEANGGVWVFGGLYRPPAAWAGTEHLSKHPTVVFSRPCMQVHRSPGYKTFTAWTNLQAPGLNTPPQRTYPLQESDRE